MCLQHRLIFSEYCCCGTRVSTSLFAGCVCLYNKRAAIALWVPVAALLCSQEDQEASSGKQAKHCKLQASELSSEHA